MHGGSRSSASVLEPTTRGRSRSGRRTDSAASTRPSPRPRPRFPTGARVGYDHDELAGLYRHRMEKANQSDYAVLFWLKDILDERSFVFDFGGHVGVSYHGWRNYLGYPPGMRWLVHDMPAIVKVGAELARERPSDGPRVHERRPRRARLQRLPRCRARCSTSTSR